MERVKAAAEATSMTIMAEVRARWVAGWPRQGGPRLGDPAPEELAGAEIAPVLHLAPVTATIRVHRAVQIVTRLPATLAAFAAGDLDLGRVLAIEEATMPLSDVLAGQVEAVVLPGAPDQTAGELRAALRRAVIVADPAAAETRRKAAVRGRSVRRYQRPDGVSAIEAVLSAIDSGEIYELIDEVARQSKTDGDTRSMDARRADAMVLLLLGRDPYLGPEDPLPPPPASPPPDPGDEPTPPWQRSPDDWQPDAGQPDDWQETSTADTDERPTSQRACEASSTARRVSVAQLPVEPRPVEPMQIEPADLDERFPPEIDHRSRLSELTARCLAAVVTRCQPPPPWVCISRTTGPDGQAVLVAELEREGPVTVEVARQLLAAGVARPPPGTESSYVVSAARARVHDPPPRLAEQVRARDGSCRFPGCRRSAHRCDLDHTVRYPDGPTTPGNLAALCRRHHRLKHRGGWTLHQLPDGVLEWTSPTGRTYQTYPRGFSGSWRGATTVVDVGEVAGLCDGGLAAR